VLERTLILTTALCVPALLGAQSDASITRAVNSITADDVARRVGILADDSMQGRNTPSPQLELTAKYIAAEFQRYGLLPGGDDDTYLQRYPLEIWGSDTAAPVLTIDGGPTFVLGTNATRVNGLYAGAGQEVTGPALLAWGTAAQPPDVAALNPAGSVVFYVAETVEGQLTSASWITVLGFRARAAALVVITSPLESVWNATLAAERTGNPTLPGDPVTVMTTGAPMVAIHADAAASLLGTHEIDLTAVMAESGGALQGRSVPDLHASVHLPRPVQRPAASAPNVVGVLEGSDPELKNEFVVFSAHMDHAGTISTGSCGASADHPEDIICNGADDNASGTVAVVELAEAFATLTPRPKRSIVFLTVSGEERGLWGSRYFADHPTIPVEQIVANVNVDMVGRNWPDTIVVIGKEHSDLGETLNRVNAEHPELNMTAIDDIWPEQSFYTRSDHYNFARKGVPVLFFFNGTHDDYHAVTDHPEKIDAEKESRIVKLLLHLGIEIANAAERPKWNPESYKRAVS
jgi:hypothetical protein